MYRALFLSLLFLSLLLAVPFNYNCSGTNRHTVSAHGEYAAYPAGWGRL